MNENAYKLLYKVIVEISKTVQTEMRLSIEHFAAGYNFPNIIFWNQFFCFVFL